MRKIIAAIALTFALQTAWAIDLNEAKAQSLVGEANTGLLAAVQQPVNAEVRALISSVNAKRTAEFERTAKKTNTTMAQVSNRFYELAVERTAAGNYYQDRNGNWKKK